MIDPDTEKVFLFGIHKGKTFGDIYDHHPTYVLYWTRMFPPHFDTPHPFEWSEEDEDKFNNINLGGVYINFESRRKMNNLQDWILFLRSKFEN